MNSVYVSGNVMMALKNAVKLKSNSVTFGFANSMVAVAVEDIIGQLSIFIDEESTHENFVIRLPKEIMSEVITAGFIRVEPISIQVLRISIYKERECISLIKCSDVPRSCSMDFAYLYEQIEPKYLTEISISQSVFSKDLLALTALTNESVFIGNGYISLQGTGIMFHKKIQDDISMTIPAEVFKYITKSINPNTTFFKNNKNTYMMRNGPMYAIWRSEYKTNKLDMSVVSGVTPLAEYDITIPEVINCGLSSNAVLKNSQVEFNLVDHSMNVATDKFVTKTRIKVNKVSGDSDIASFRLSSQTSKLLNSIAAIRVAVFYKFIRIGFSDGLLDIGGVVDVQ